MKALMLAGGIGTRLQPLTDHLPKVMVEIGGKPVLEHLIHLCAHHGIHDIVLGLYYLPEKIQNYFGDGDRFDVRIQYSIEPEMRGGAGAMKHAAQFLSDEDFFVFSGDVMTNVDLTAMSAFHREKGGLGTFLVHATDHPYDSDVVEYDENGLVKRFFRPQMGETFRAISKTGTHIFKPDVLSHIPEGIECSLEKQLIPNLLAQNQLLYAYDADCYSKDMGTPERLAQVTRDDQDGKISF
jgi:NDP-sugar pyrophosphorylase family protein